MTSSTPATLASTRIQDAQNKASTLAGAGTNVVRDGQFVFIAALDGTSNTKDHPSCSRDISEFKGDKSELSEKDRTQKGRPWRPLLFAACCALLGLAGIQYAAAQTTVDDIPWEQRTHEQRFVQSSYEDEFTFKHKKIFYKDPFIWVVSKEFAERFGMPKQWIDPDLRGALAVAWRTTTTDQTTCGHGGNPEACWPAFTCQMDIYVDSRAPIPWRFDDVERDFLWPGLSSLDYVPRRPPAPRRSRYMFTEGHWGSKGEPFHSGALEYKAGGGATGFVISYFDRAYAPGVTLLGFRSACPSHVEKASAAALRFFTEEERRRTRGRIQNYTHTVEIPDGFMRRITEIHRHDWEEHQKVNTAYQQMIRRHFPHLK